MFNWVKLVTTLYYSNTITVSIAEYGSVDLKTDAN